jgi:hypothetical protein
VNRRRRRMVHVEALLGRPVVDPTGCRVGRLEEIRTERHGDAYEVVEYRIGPGSLLHRWPMLGQLFRRKTPTLIARWDQLEIRRDSKLQLTCETEQLARRRP